VKLEVYKPYLTSKVLRTPVGLELTSNFLVHLNSARI
jgi:hypothetical protein